MKGKNKLINLGTMEKISTKCTLSFISLFYANSLLHVSALLGHPQGDAQAVSYITAVEGYPVVAGVFSCPYCKQHRNTDKNI
jgi:hypothetical protein